MSPLRASSAAVYRRSLWLLLLPYLLGALVLVGVPAALTFALALTEYDGLSAPRWAGLDNLWLLLADARFPLAVRNSLHFILLAVPARVLVALGLALLLHRTRCGVGAWRAAVVAPTVLPEVAYALAWLWILNPLYGPLNLLLGALGIAGPAWLVDAQSARPALALMTLWQVGEGFVLLLAALRAIPADLYAAAAVDGAGRWDAFRRVTLPLLRPWLALLAFREVILTFQSTFTPAYLMTRGDPYYATLFLPLLAYEEAVSGLRFGAGAMVSALMFLAAAALGAGFFFVLRRGGYAYEA